MPRPNKRIKVPIATELHDKLAIVASQQGKSVDDLVNEFLADWAKKEAAALKNKPLRT